MTREEKDFTDDTLFGGRLVCRQYRSGYRFSVDAVLAAHFSTPEHGNRILDLGCGCGVIGLILAYRHPGVTIAGIEVQPELARLAEQNVAANGLAERVSVAEGNFRDIGRLADPESFDMVVSNPPYRKKNVGRISVGAQRARARHEIDASLADMVRAAAYAVRNRGKVVAVYPAVRCVSLLAELCKHSLEPKRLQPVYGYPGRTEASLVLVEAVKNGGEEVRLLPPFYVYTEKNGPYTEAMQKLYS